MDNAELAAKLSAIAEALASIDDELFLFRQRAFPQPPPRPQPRDAGSWPWTPDTVAQGFLAGRWLRRDGDVYGSAGLRAESGPNSPIKGGDDANARVDVPSGAPRAP